MSFQNGGVKDYGVEAMETLIDHHDVEWFRGVAVGSISSFWGSLTESILLTIFVIPASITAVDFYRKQGYDFKNGIKELDEEGHYRLEKFRKVE